MFDMVLNTNYKLTYSKSRKWIEVSTLCLLTYYILLYTYYIYIYILIIYYIYIYIYVYIVQWKNKCTWAYDVRRKVWTHDALGRSCHKVIVVITGRAHCFHDCICIKPTLRPSYFCEVWALCVSWITYDHLTTYIYIYIYKIKYHDDFLHEKCAWYPLIFPEILMIKESCNLIGREAQLVTPDQKSVGLKCYFLLMNNFMQRT